MLASCIPIVSIRFNSIYGPIESCQLRNKLIDNHKTYKIAERILIDCRKELKESIPTQSI